MKIFRNKNPEHEDLIDDIPYRLYRREDKSLKDLSEKRPHLSLSNRKIKQVFKLHDRKTLDQDLSSIWNGK